MRHAFEASDKPYSELHPLLKLASALCQTRVNWKSPKLLQTAKMLWILALFADPTSTGTAGDRLEFLGKLCCHPDDDIQRRVDDRSQELGPELFDMMEFCSKPIIAGFEGPNQSIDRQAMFGLHACGKRRFQVAWTTGDEFAIVPPEASVGDQIVLLRGYQDLCLLRKQDDHYIYIGPVGIAKEITQMRLDQIGTGQAELQQIEIH